MFDDVRRSTRDPLGDQARVHSVPVLGLLYPSIYPGPRIILGYKNIAMPARLTPISGSLLTLGCTSQGLGFKTCVATIEWVGAAIERGGEFRV